ncbi:50s ribosomal protein l17 [Stylonychia lemnae]|uniref:50s ribosomal protein l17 n=1 Tax=Stylonychia lemnae TaxID=5949 RepID=A0A078AFX3_STYLE|nr:50s ribosomal protein l17 [Stylonychia lemnae]|eukprot:CDW81190.1 50s ribosomal protein l17 [Stylonychia lemnae]
MRHKNHTRKFGRDHKHRKAMMRNLITSLVTHDRITTTLAKAKELRPLAEKIIRKAKEQGYQGNVFLKQTLFTKKSIERAKTELAPRFQDLAAGFTRVKYLGRRTNDKAKFGYIEFIKNPIEQYEKNEIKQEIEKNGIQSFWAWEKKILKQEKGYFKQQITQLKQKIDLEVESVLQTSAGNNQSEMESFNAQIRADVEKKYAQKRKFLEVSLERVIKEQAMHRTQENHKTYQKLTEGYAFPIDEFRIKQFQSL